MMLDPFTGVTTGGSRSRQSTDLGSTMDWIAASVGIISWRTGASRRRTARRSREIISVGVRSVNWLIDMR